MQIPVLLERMTSNGYRATTGQPLVVSAEGATREQALERLRSVLEDRLSRGAEIAPLELPVAEHALASYAGMFRDNPLFDAWQQAIADYREKADEETEGP